MFATNFDELLNSPNFYENPHAVYHQLRRDTPVYWSEAWQAWVLTRYDDVMSVLRQSDLFSSAGRVRYLLNSLPDETRRQVAALERHYDIGLAHSDPPDHTRLRRLLTKVFTPRMVEQRRERVQAVVNGLIDAVQAQGEMDIIADIAYPLPATIIAEMLGAPERDIARFRDWAVAINGLFALGGRMSGAAARAAQDSLAEMRAYITALADQKREQPQDDILSKLVTAEAEADRLSLDELVSTAVTFFVAGHETTTNLIGNGMLALLQHPQQMAKLRDDPALIDDAVEEMLRYEPSVPRAWRIAKEDVEIGGRTIERGTLVFPMLAAANRDPDHFPEPDRFDIQRNNNKHVAFGYGIHFCLGAPLARLEGAVAINAIMARLPNLRLSDQARRWHHDVAIRSLHALPVHF